VKSSVVFNLVEKIVNPLRLADLTESHISHWQATLRKEGLSETTIKSYSAHLKAALRWAERMGMLVKVPKIDMPKRVKGAKVMKGRPITGEEFERMLAKVPAVVGKAAVQSWVHYLKGLWWSGLRLGESLELWWDRDDRLSVDLSSEYPMMQIPAECEKGYQDRLLPMAPEFAEFLLALPEAERIGRVFKPQPPKRVCGERLCDSRVSKIVAAVGKAAGVKVATRSKIDPETGRRVEVVKYASAHDLRRSFGERWAARVMPTDLMALMRHESIETTLRYYVGRNAQATAKTLWEAHKKAAASNTLGNIGQVGPDSAVSAGDLSSDGERACEVGPGGVEPPTKGL